MLDDDALHTLRHSQQAAGRVPRNLLTLPELVRLALDTSDDGEDGENGRSQDPIMALLSDERPIADWTVAERTAFLRRLVDESLASTVRGAAQCNGDSRRTVNSCGRGLVRSRFAAGATGDAG